MENVKIEKQIKINYHIKIYENKNLILTWLIYSKNIIKLKFSPNINYNIKYIDSINSRF